MYGVELVRQDSQEMAHEMAVKGYLVEIIPAFLVS